VNSDASIQNVVATAVQAAADVDWRQAALDWGVSFKSLKGWITNRSESRFPAEFLVPLCGALGNFSPLDCLEQEANRVAISVGKFPPASADSFRDILRRVLDDSRPILDQKLLAKKLGTDYRQLRYFVGPDTQRRLPAAFVVPLCKNLGNYRLLDFLEFQVGRLAFQRPEARSPGAEDISDFHKLLEESLEAVKTASASMRDNNVDIGEAQSIVLELDTVLRHSLRLRQWLEMARLRK